MFFFFLYKKKYDRIYMYVGDKMVYTSVDNDKIKEIKKLQTKKYRDLTNSFLVEGEHLVDEAYKTGLLEKVIVLDNFQCKMDVPIINVNLKVMKYLSELDTPSKIIGICNKKNGIICGNKIVALDNVQDPGNLGTIIRSCVAFNIDTLILSKECVDLYNSKVIRASQGMLFNLNVVIDDLDVLKRLDGYEIFATKVNGGENLKTLKKPDKYVIVMGNEGNGVSKKVLDICSRYLYIDMNNKCESLNVGVATSIILYELDK